MHWIASIGLPQYTKRRTNMTPNITETMRELPKGYKIYPEIDGARFETPTTVGWCNTSEIALEEIKREIKTGEPAWRIPFGKSKRGLKRHQQEGK
jgi:hypothetical protein